MRIGLIVPPGFAVFSFAPLSVFEAANGVLGKPFYEIHAVSVTGGTSRIRSGWRWRPSA
jgi:transcriptional regulator GlxA family with amidase domain